jgi:penicillin-binding protein 1A
MGYDNPRKLGDRETGGSLSLPVWVDYMGYALKGVPIQEPAPPEGVVNMNGEWYYDEYTHANGVSNLGLEDKPAPAPDEEERKSILDLFRR